MWSSSVALKRSLIQIGKRSAANANRPCPPPTAGLCRRSVPRRSGAGNQCYGSSSSTEPHRDNSGINDSNDNQNNGTIRFTMTPKQGFGTPSHQQQDECGSVRGRGCSSDGSSSSNDDDDTKDDRCKTTDDRGKTTAFDPNAAAEQMMYIMDNSYYFASFEAGEGLSSN